MLEIILFYLSFLMCYFLSAIFSAFVPVRSQSAKLPVIVFLFFEYPWRISAIFIIALSLREGRKSSHNTSFCSASGLNTLQLYCVFSEACGEGTPFTPSKNAKSPFFCLAPTPPAPDPPRHGRAMANVNRASLLRPHRLDLGNHHQSVGVQNCGQRAKIIMVAVFRMTNT